MPCFRGVAISIHANGVLTEHAIQKQSRQSRISSYIAVPPAKVPRDSVTGKPEQAGFAISITLLTPGLSVPYSTPKPTEQNPNPRPLLTGGALTDYEKPGSYVQPYMSRTANPSETLAAYIYFDGRAKEEVATLLRRGEETWVNSRWVSVPASEGGGLAEREFLFREVGLDRWLKGLDLEGGKDKAERIERRQQRLEKRRQKKREGQRGIKLEQDSDMEGPIKREQSPGFDAAEDTFFPPNSDSDSEDEPPEPEAAGQIKVALFRVLASGEIKRGEYSPQFDAHDDDDGTGQNGNDGGSADVDHTTSFAKPKSLDPKSISTQTVTGIDPPDRPYATFTFFYRGEKQLQKMGIIKETDVQKTPQSSRKQSSARDLASKLGPLKKSTFGTVGFSGYRDPGKKKRIQDDDDAMDSDADDEGDGKLPTSTDDNGINGANGTHLSPDDAKIQGEIEDGVQKIKLKRAHSAEPLEQPSSTRKAPHLRSESSNPGLATPQSNGSSSNSLSPPEEPTCETGGSPYKRVRSVGSNDMTNVAGAASMENSGSGSLQPQATATPDIQPQLQLDAPTDDNEIL